MYGSSPGRYGALAAGSPAATATATAALAIVGSGGTAIAKALNMASLKLFGSPSENIWLRKIGHRRPIQRHSSGSGGGGGTPLTVEEDNLLSDLEDIAQKATVIFDFADSKLVLMTSLMVSRGGADGAGTPAAVMQASYASPFFANAQQQARTARTSSFSSDRSAVSPLVPTSAASPVLSQQQVTSPAGTGKTDSVRKPELLPGETLVLYLKALAFLQKGIELARDYWSSKPAERPTSADLNECECALSLETPSAFKLTRKGRRAMVPVPLQRVFREGRVGKRPLAWRCARFGHAGRAACL
jgi:serine/threonine-protein kinase ULK/ATG1